MKMNESNQEQAMKIEKESIRASVMGGREWFLIILTLNKRTGRYHAFFYYQSPFPGGSAELLRYKSKGHHVLGCETEKEGWQSAQDIKAQIVDSPYFDTGEDGDDIRVMPTVRTISWTEHEAPADIIILDNREDQTADTTRDYVPSTTVTCPPGFNFNAEAVLRTRKLMDHEGHDARMDRQRDLAFERLLSELLDRMQPRDFSEAIEIVEESGLFERRDGAWRISISHKEIFGIPK